MTLTSGRTLDVERYQRVKRQNSNRSSAVAVVSSTSTSTRSTPNSTSTSTANVRQSLTPQPQSQSVTTTPTSTNKTVMTWKELEATFGDSTKMSHKKKKNSSSASTRTPTPKTPIRLSATTAASPLTQRIRQQILKSDCSVGISVSTTTTPSSKQSVPASTLSLSTTKRRQRLEKHQHRLGHRSSSPAVTTATATATTPLRKLATTPPRPTSTLRVSTAMATTPCQVNPSFLSPRPPSSSTILTTEEKTTTIATPNRQPPPRTPVSNSNSNTMNSVRKSQNHGRPASNQTLYLTPPPPMVPPKSASKTNTSISRAATTPRTPLRAASPRMPLRAVTNSVTTPTSTRSNRSALKNQETNKYVSLSSKKKSKQQLSPFSTSGRFSNSTTPKHKQQDTPTSTPSRSASTDSCVNGTRMNLDKRSARLRYSNDFSTEIANLHQEQQRPLSVDQKALQDNNNNNNIKNDQGVFVFVRKRPIFRDELQRGDFDVVATTTSSESDVKTSSSSPFSCANNVVVYRTQMHADMKTKQVQPVVFGCTAAFDEKVSSVDVYLAAAMPLVRQAVEGGIATILMFGQTGSGKTYTMTAMEELLAADVFTTTGKRTVQVCVQYLELCGKICRDLLDDSRAEVRIMDNNDEDGSVCFVNATSVMVETPEELAGVMAEAKQRRATQATEKNDESSRSHAVCQMTIYANANFEEESSQGHAARHRGVLTLVDCAGTERRNDSMYHSRSRQAESNEINASLYALKECIRARSSSSSSRYVPYRSNNLTRVLRESLERQDARLAVIATVAPNATDTEHTIQTLKTVSTLIGSSSEEGRLQKVSPSSSKGGDEHPIAPKKWDHPELVKWLTEKRLLKKPVPAHVDGRRVMLYVL